MLNHSPLNKLPDSVATPNYAAIHPLRPVVLAGQTTLCVFMLAVVAVYLLCESFVAVWRLWLWTGFSVLLMVCWVTILIVMSLRKPNPEELVRLWSLAARFLIYGSHTVVFSALWLLLPFCPLWLQLVLALMFLLNSPMQIIASPESVFANRLGITITNGSLVLFLLSLGEASAWLVALFVAAIGVGSYLMCPIISRTIGIVNSERLASDEMARQLEHALVAVSAERDAKTRFIASASHDLGQPLQAANLFFDQSLRAHDAVTRAKAAEGVRRALSSAELLLQHMLNHLRLEADAVEPVLTRVAVGPLLAKQATQHGPAATAAGIAIRVVATEHVLRLDPILLERALSNLVTNALVHSQAKRLLLAARSKDKATLQLWVIDDGVGIGEADSAHIFEDYYRGTGTRSALMSGFGLGLSSVRRIASLMGGEAGLDRRWHPGAAFYLEFPKSDLPRRKQRRLALASTS